MTDTRTITAVFRDPAVAERAVERLRAIGVPEPSIEVHRAEEGEVAAEVGPAGGAFAGISAFFMPHRAGYPGETEHPATVVLARAVPEEISSRAIEILEEDAVDVHEERHAGPAADEGTTGRD